MTHGVTTTGEGGSCRAIAVQHASETTTISTAAVAMAPIGTPSSVLVIVMATVSIIVPARRGQDLIQIAVRFLLYARSFVRSDNRE